jgi:hypothetical protein
MAFTVNDFHDLSNLLRQNPEWREELRRQVLTDELLALPQTVQRLADAHARAEERLQRLETAVSNLTAAQTRADERLQRLETAVTNLVAAQQRTEQRVEALAQAQQRFEQRMEALAAAQQRNEDQIRELIKSQQETEIRLQRVEAAIAELTRTVAEQAKTIAHILTRLNRLDGWRIERNYIDRAAGYFGSWLRRVRVLWPGELDEALETEIDTALSNEERADLLRVDAIVRGKARTLSEQPEIYLAVEASLTIEADDVVRAQRCAALLRRLGVKAIPVVAGEAITTDAQTLATNRLVAVLENGHSQGWENALAGA